MELNLMYKAILDNMNEEVYVRDLDKNVLYINPASEKLTGWSLDEIIGKKCYEVFGDEDLTCKEVCPVERAISKKNHVLHHEGKLKIRSGDVRNMQVSISPLYENENITGAVVVMEDISRLQEVEETHIKTLIALEKERENRKRTEEALLEHTSMLEDILGKAADGICVCHNITEEPYVRFTHWNLMMTKITGYTMDEINRLGWYQTMYSDAEVQKRAVERMVRMRKGDDIQDEEWVITTKCGEKKSLSISTSIVKQEHGKVHVLAIMHDLTERKQAEQILRKSESKFRSLFDLSPQAIALTEVDTGKLIDVNERFCELVKYYRKDLMGLTTIQAGFYNEEDRNRFIKELQASGEVNGLEMDFKAKDGSIIKALMFARVINIMEKPLILTILYDMTTQRQLEDQLRQSHKMEAVGTLAGGIAHEFNNILGIIIGNTELALDDVPEWNPAKDCLEEIREASLRAKDVVRQIMSFARKTSSDRKPIRISTIIADSLKLLRATIPTTITIQQEILCETELISGNPTEINQVLINLCTNSLHAMEDKAGVLDVRLEVVNLDDDSIFPYEGLKPGGHVKLTVKDSGKGIPSEIMDRVFDPYFTTKDVDKGLGMGLAVVFGIVMKHDGAIRIESEVDKGTTVEVLFPMIEAQADVDVEKPLDLPGGSERILFVDDEPSLVKLAKRILERLGYRVVGKTNSMEALKRFQSEPDQFDLVITDMSMPQMSGDQLAEELIKVRSDVPIILCTGHSDRIDEVRAKKLGIRAYTMKPLKKKEIVVTIREVLDGGR